MSKRFRLGKVSLGVGWFGGEYPALFKITLLEIYDDGFVLFGVTVLKFSIEVYVG